VSVFLEVPEAAWVCANELAFAFRDRCPVSPGHTLVVTRRMTPDWFSATEDEQRAVLALVTDVKRRLDDELAPDGYNVGFNAGVAAGQTVMHLHVHVIPRYAGDVPDPPPLAQRGSVPFAGAERVQHLDEIRRHVGGHLFGRAGSLGNLAGRRKRCSIR